MQAYTHTLLCSTRYEHAAMLTRYLLQAYTTERWQTGQLAEAPALAECTGELARDPLQPHCSHGTADYAWSITAFPAVLSMSGVSLCCATQSL